MNLRERYPDAFSDTAQMTLFRVYRLGLERCRFLNRIACIRQSLG